jgi:hypothetical protein
MAIQWEEVICEIEKHDFGAICTVKHGLPCKRNAKGDGKG